MFGNLNRLSGLIALRTLNIDLLDPLLTSDAMVQFIDEHPKLEILKIRYAKELTPNNKWIQLRELVNELKSRIFTTTVTGDNWECSLE